MNLILLLEVWYYMHSDFNHLIADRYHFLIVCYPAKLLLSAASNYIMRIIHNQL